MIKYSSNSFLATCISFSNEIANLCDKLKNVDSVDVLDGLHLDHRISPLVGKKTLKSGITSFLHPGVGFGGSCFPKDIKSLIHYAQTLGNKMNLLKEVININENQYNRAIDKLKNSLIKLKNKKIAILGLSFKPGTDDIRETPALPIINELLNLNCYINAHDPIAIKNFQKVLKHKKLTFYEDLVNCIKKCDAIILITAWNDYKNLHKVLQKKDTLVVDGRRFLDKNNFLNYEGIGLGLKPTKGNIL